MKQIYTNEDYVLAKNSQNRLQAVGIEVEFRHEFLAGGATTGHVWPELWVDDRDYELAVKVLSEGMTDAAVARSRRDWACSTCGELDPGNFAACWKCQGRAPRDPLARE